jgi:EAL domain-containing protein (putative c-di-GMP-specific phosphodiesterase class I)
MSVVPTDGLRLLEEEEVIVPLRRSVMSLANQHELDKARGNLITINGSIYTSEMRRLAEEVDRILGEQLQVRMRALS